ncbi:MAG: hypothetical protein GY929_19575 [Actinomycetia bacterium]|nr:hypothetical protein [Actinomycetes bacterium]
MWTNDDRTTEKLALYDEVRGSMRQGARKGLWSLLGQQPLEHDVDDALIAAFEQLWGRDPATVESPQRLGYTYAYRRGQDQARRILREQRRARPTAVMSSGVDEGEAVDEVHYAARAAFLVKCKQDLTEEQQAVIAATVEGHFGEEPMLLTEWARSDENASKKKYQAWQQQRARGLDSLRRCIERHEANGGDN